MQFMQLIKYLGEFFSAPRLHNFITRNVLPATSEYLANIIHPISTNVGYRKATRTCNAEKNLIIVDLITLLATLS